MSYEILVLRFIHVVGGAFWFGAAMASVLWFGPAIAAAGPAAAQVSAVLQRRKMMTVMPIVAGLVLLSGFRLLWIVSGGFEGHYFHTAVGHTYAVAGGIGVLGFLFGLFVARPLAMKGKMWAMYAANVMLALAMIGMAMARHLA